MAWKKYDSSGVSTFLYYFCKSQSKVSKMPHNALLSISDLILDNWELWDHPFNHSRVGWGQISPFAINQLYDPHTSKRWHRKWQNSLFSIKIIETNSKNIWLNLFSIVFLLVFVIIVFIIFILTKHFPKIDESIFSPLYFFS